MSLLKPLSAFAAAAAASASVSLGWAAGLGTGSSAVDQELPDLGSPATAAVSLEEEYRAGLGWFGSIRQTGQIIEDPEISDYIQQIGHSLSSHAEEGQHQFYYFVLKDPVINAFAMPGGFIAINSGLILATSNENELAGVMAHETAHVTQRHLVRGLIDQSHAGLMSTAAMLAAILLGATAGRGSPDAMEGAILATQSAAIQHQINYTRANEFEADRIGIGTMASAGYDPLGMASFFQTLDRNSPDPSRVKAVEFLIDHPLSAERVAEARNRAEQIGRLRHSDSLGYTLMRERLRSMIGNPQAARDYYASLAKNGAGKNSEERYGKAVADIATRNPAAAIPDLQALVNEYPKVNQFYGALGQAYLANGQLKESQAVLDKALDLFPRNVPVTIRLAETLMRAGDNKRAHLILDDLFNVVEPTPEQTRLIAKAAYAAGDLADSYYYMSFFYLMSGDLRMAANQLELGLGLPALDPIQRARISARLEEVRAAMPKDRKQPSPTTTAAATAGIEEPRYDGRCIAAANPGYRSGIRIVLGKRFTMLNGGYARAALGFACALSLSACVTLPPNSKRVPQDPWESWNRGVYKVNDKLDRAIAKPVAQAYVRVVPRALRTGVTNFFENLNTPTVMINDALQGKVLAAANDLGRFLLNSTVGLAGLLDPATSAGLARNDEDFGQTLGRWGVHPGPFVELPILGPSDLRDASSKVVDSYTNPRQYVKNSYVKYGLYLPYLVDKRAALLPLDDTLSHVFDPYAFVRDAYLQRRAYQVSDGKVTDEEPLLDPDADNPDSDKPAAPGDTPPASH